MKRLLIIGAGGFGREIYSWTSRINAFREEWTVEGFLDANLKALDRYDISASIVGDPKTYLPRSDDIFICAIGDPVTKLNLCRDLKDRGAAFINLIHPLAYIAKEPRMGEGCILSAYSSLSPDVLIGEFVTFNAYSNAGHDAQIGDGCTISSHCDITGRVVLGEGVFLGSHATILPGKKVGNFAKIGAGSVVVRNVPPGTSVMGVPAKMIAGFGTGNSGTA